MRSAKKSVRPTTSTGGGKKGETIRFARKRTLCGRATRGNEREGFRKKSK